MRARRSRCDELARAGRRGKRTDGEVRAISDNAWFSLGKHGLGLHFEKKPGRTVEALVLRKAVRGKIWEVSLDGAAKGRFSILEEVVAAVDYEIDRMGRGAAFSARREAEWRRSPRADALRLATWDHIYRGNAAVKSSLTRK